MNDSLELHVVRHGETAWNKEGRLQGQIDIPLNDVGIEQAHALARELKDVSYQVVYSSDLKRAKETAEIIIAAQSGVIQFHTIEQLREFGFGEMEGASAKERPDLFNKFLQGDGSGILGAETAEQFRQRVLGAFREIKNRHQNESRVLVVAHGGVVRVLQRESNTMDSSTHIKNCGLYTFWIDGLGAIVKESPNEVPFLFTQ